MEARAQGGRPAILLLPADPRRGKVIRDVFPRHTGKIVETMQILTKKEQETLGRLCRKLGLGQYSA